MSKTDSFFIVFILIVWGIGGFPVALCAQGAAGVLPETHLVEVGKGIQPDFRQHCRIP